MWKNHPFLFSNNSQSKLGFLKIVNNSEYQCRKPNILILEKEKINFLSLGLFETHLTLNLCQNISFTRYLLYQILLYPLCFPILGGCDSTRALQSSPFQKYANLKKSQKITFFKEKKIWRKKNGKKILSSLFSNIGSTRFDQSSPDQLVLEFRGGSLSVTQ